METKVQIFHLDLQNIEVTQKGYAVERMILYRKRLCEILAM